MRLELPNRPEGALPEQVEQPWEYIFKIIPGQIILM